MITINSFDHPYLDDEDVNGLVFSSFCDKTISNFIKSVSKNVLYKKHIVKDDIFETYKNFIKNIDSLTIIKDLSNNYNSQNIIDLVVNDSDEFLISQDIELDEDDSSLPLIACDSLNHLIKAITNKSESF